MPERLPAGRVRRYRRHDGEPGAARAGCLSAVQQSLSPKAGRGPAKGIRKIMRNGLHGVLSGKRGVLPVAINRHGWATSVTASSSWL